MGRFRNDRTSDVMLWASVDGYGKTWKAFSISHWHNVLLGQRYNKSFVEAHSYSPRVNSTVYTPRETQSYTSLVPLANGSVLVIYDRRAKNVAGKLEEQVYSMVISAGESPKAEDGVDATEPGGDVTEARY